MKREIVEATAIYTGGNIYIYYGRLSDGNYFKACDDFDFIEICDSDTSIEEADYQEFYEKHSVETLTKEEYKMFWNEMLLWILHNAPKGNYVFSELEERLIEKPQFSVQGNKKGYDLTKRKYILNATVEEVINELSKFPKNAKFYIAGSSDFFIHANEEKVCLDDSSLEEEYDNQVSE